ncbi:hypothetical protein KUTeg_002559 [Tegillarca granosa]|uniref:DAGKc domain-containing protein n=1 Tax=Tegillarca granosa TaxID=220873 RepID=A0ABQ9FVZ9_TEGGR|nr:hypothetical protein KUTeg_002559 [Tegillarca granosa]
MLIGLANRNFDAVFITTRPKRLLVIINPVSGNHTSERDFKTIVKPIFESAGITTDVLETLQLAAIKSKNRNQYVHMSFTKIKEETL